MSEVYDHNPEEHDDPSAGPTWLTTVVGVLLLVATVLGTTALYYNVKAGEVEREVIARPFDAIGTMRKNQLARIEGTARKVTRVGENGEMEEAFLIPIDRAMEIVVAEHQKR